MTRAREKNINIRTYYFIINVIMLLKYPKQNYWQCMNSSLFLYKNKSYYQHNKSPPSSSIGKEREKRQL